MKFCLPIALLMAVSACSWPGLSASARVLPALPETTGTINVVLDYNADPTGASPSSTAIQNAFDDAVSGDEVLFPSGVYRIDRPVWLYTPHVLIIGEAAENPGSMPRSVLKFDNDYDFWDNTPHRKGMLNICADYVTVTGLFFDENFRAAGRKYGHGHPMIGGDIYVGCRWHSPPNSTATVGTVAHVSITDNVIWDYYGHGIVGYNTEDDYFTVDNNQLYSDYFVRGLTLAPSHASGVHGHQAISATSGDHIIFSNNKIFDAMDDALAVHYDCSDVKIENNFVTTVGGRLLVSGVTDGTIRGNTIIVDGDTAAGILVTFADSQNKFSPNNGVEIYDNRVVVRNDIPIDSGIRLKGPGDYIDVHDNFLLYYATPPPPVTFRRAIGVFITPRYSQHEQKQIYGNHITISHNYIRNFLIGIREVESFIEHGNDVTICGNKVLGAETVTLPSGLNPPCAQLPSH